MSQDQGLAGRLAFNDMDEAGRAALRELRPLIERVLPGILAAFYGRISRTPEANRFYSSEASMRHAEEMHFKHWMNIASGEFGESYIQSVTHIGEAHHRLGVPPRWYIGGYNFVLNGLLKAIQAEYKERLFVARRRRTKKAALQAALTTAAMIDMDYAISVYIDRAEQGREAHRAAVFRMADDFEQAAGNIVANVSSASGELEVAAQSMTRTADETQQLSTAVTAASEEASSKVASVATATGEMSASVNEIGRQVQESSRIAKEAVVQAQKTDSRIAELSSRRRPDRRRHQADHRGRRTDQSAGAQCDHRGGAGRRGRSRLRRGRAGGQGAGRPDRQGDRRDRQRRFPPCRRRPPKSVTAIKEIGGTIGRIADIAHVIAKAVEDQGAATQAITVNIQQASQGTVEVVKNIADVSRGAVETGSASARVLVSARSLSSESGRLKTEVEKFLVAVREGPANRRMRDDPNYSGPERRKERTAQVAVGA